MSEEVRKELDLYKQKSSELEKRVEEQRKEGERVSKQLGETWSQGWTLLLGVVIGIAVNLVFSAVRRCGRKRRPTNIMAQRPETNEVF